MNPNQNIKVTQKATQMALQKLTKLAVSTASIKTQKRALSFLKPAAASNVVTPQSEIGSSDAVESPKTQDILVDRQKSLFFNMNQAESHKNPLHELHL